ncbi:MAG TPA: PAS domain S-box protein, partial [Gemmatimonadaceae bacterium]|nr:PAS domain S-box protein [Gemmatimonadaceae bacterium]
MILLDTDYLPHGYCYLWDKPLLWTHVVSDTLIGVSYVTISLSLAILVHRLRREIPFNTLFIAFGLFIIACGMTHFMEVWTLWQPHYWLAGGVKIVTAAASVVTAIAMPFMVPRVQRAVRDAKQGREQERWLARAAALEESHEQLQHQTVELEQQQEETEALAAELEQTNAELRTSEARYRLLFEVNPLPTMVLEASSLRILAVNRVACEHYGYERDHFVTLTMRDLCAPEDLPILEQLMAQPIERRYRPLAPGRIRHHDARGRILDVEVASDALEFEGHDAWLLVVHDVSAQRRAEETIRTTTDRLTALFSGSPLAVVATDQRNHVTMWNPAAERMFGWTAAEVTGKPLPYLLDDGDHALGPSSALSPSATASHDGATGVFRREVQRRRKDGTSLTTEISTAPLHDRDGEVVGWMKMLADVTQAKQLEAQLAQAQKMEAVGQLAGGVAHDFNNILTAIMGFAELLTDDLRGIDAQRYSAVEDVQEILRQADRGTALVRQLLTFGRRQLLAPQVFDVNETVRTVDRMLRRLIGANINLQTVLTPQPAYIHADVGQLEQVIVNLAVNARDAMPDGGMLIIETAVVDVGDPQSQDSTSLSHLQRRTAPLTVDLTPGPYVRLSITDTGIGMDAETQRHIFEPFFTTKEPGKGTGLGLSTVYGIVRQSGGGIGVSSEVGHGTILTLYFPGTTPATTGTTADVTTSVAVKGTERILVVEDEEAIRRLMRSALERHGYHVRLVPDGRQALDLLETQSGAIDLVISDIVMPHMSGPDFVKRLLERWPAMRIL